MITRSTNAFELSQKPPPWKDPHNEFVLDLLGWSIRALDRKAIEQNWHLLVPPVLKMLDDTEVESKAKGCRHLTQLLLTLQLASNRDASAAFLARTGYYEVFASTLWPLLTYIPSLTPESDSVTIFESVYGPLRSLAVLARTEKQRVQFVDKLMREGVLAPLSHFPSPSTYPNLASSIIRQINEIAALLGIDAVKHLPALIPLLTSIIQDPFILSHKRLVLAALGGLQSLMQICWPRLSAHRGAITLGLCVLKRRCDEEGSELNAGEDGGQGTRDLELSNVREELKDTAELLDAVLSQSEINEEWRKEKAALVEANMDLRGVFES